MSDKILKKILVVIFENFPNGVRADFITDNQIRRAYKLKYNGEEIPAMFDLITFIKKQAYFSDDKYYFVDLQKRNRVMRLVDATLNAGNIIVYYDEFFKRHRDMLQDLRITTPALLSSVLRATEGRFACSEKYIAINKFVKLSDVIEYLVRALPSGESFSARQLKEELPYVPEDEIIHVLNRPRKYLKTTNGKYLSAEQVSVDQTEVVEVQNLLLTDLKKNGHAIFNLQDFQNTLELNPELSDTTISNFLFEHFLSADFSRHGNILTARGSAVSGIKLLKKFCAAHDELTINELFDRAKKINVIQHTATIEAANESMIRVSKNLFVKESFIKFDVSAIDDALSSFVQGKIIALQDVKSFSKFAPVEDVRGFEWEWNLYLLESFLCKKSKRFQFHTSSPNNLAKGAICPREKIFLDYVDLMSAVVVQEKIPLTSTSVNDFLITKNFRTRRVDRVTSSIIERAHVLLSRRL